jgi:hypothetical protein
MHKVRNKPHNILFTTEQFADAMRLCDTYLLTPWSRVLLEKLTSFRS